MTVIYAEKFSMHTTIVQALNEKGSVRRGKGYSIITYNGEETYVTYGVGHLCELKQPEDYNLDFKNWRNKPLPFIPETFETKKKVKVLDQTKVVADLFKKADFIINATDCDREGELIFYYLYTTLKCKKPFKRVNIQSTTKEGIKEAFSNLKPASEVKNITDAGRARGIADWLIGNNITTAMTLGYSEKDVLSIGRVQTPTLNILVKKEKEIQNFKSEKYWELNATFITKDGKKYVAKHKNDRFTDYNVVKSLFNKTDKKNGIVTNAETKIESREAPHLFDLSSLQMMCNSKFGYTLQETLDITQSLYEKGYVTYPRTESRYLPEDMVKDVDKLLDTLAKLPQYTSLVSGKPKKYNKKHYFDDAKISSHYAIIPTTKIPSSLPKNEENVYDTICRSVIAMLYGPAIIEKTILTTTVEGEDFVSKGSAIKDPQWMSVISTGTKEEFLPLVSTGDEVSGRYDLVEKATKPPKRHTDRSLLYAMLHIGEEIEDKELRDVLAVKEDDKGGIGTPATRAGIVEKLILRGYAIREKKNIIPTEKGIALIDIIPIEEIKSPVFTAEWELRLSNIAKGKDSFNAFVKDIEKLTIKWCNDVVSNSKSASKISTSTSDVPIDIMCPICSKPLRKMKWGWGCSGYKEGCKFSIGSIAGKKLTDTQVKQLVEKGKTNEIKGFTSKTGKKFSAKLKMEDGKILFEF